MKRMSKLAGRLALVAMMAATGAVHADDQDIIDYRKHVMASMREQMTILNMIVDKRAPADDLVTHVKVLATTATTAKAAFEQELPGGSAKPEVWSDWAKFAKQMDDLVAATAGLEKSAQEGGVDAVAAGIKTLDCKGCHNAYRVPKSK